MDEFRTVAPEHNHEGDSGEFVTLPGERKNFSRGSMGPGIVLLRRYKIISELGQGGMGIVYKCFDEVAGIEVALKALPPELSHNMLEMEDIKENFQLVSKLVHQNIAVNRMLEKDSVSGDYFLIMECAEGEDLRRWIKRQQQTGSISIEQVQSIVRQVAAALDYAHAQKVMHRDIKPGNIMINQQGAIKVLDFGLAAQIHTSMSRFSVAYRGTSGTGPYMAPEQWRGMAQGAASDQYALGVMAYELLAGHLPFEGSDPAVLKQAVLDEKPRRIPGIPKFMQAAITRAMSKKAEDRFASCSEFADALEKPQKMQIGRKQVKLIAGALVAAIALGAGTWGVVQLVQQKKEKERIEAAEQEKFKQKQLRQQREAEKKLAQERELKAREQKCKSRILSLEILMTEIDRLDHAPGRTFDQYKSELKMYCSNAKTATGQKNYQVAGELLDKAEKSAEWLRKNLPLSKMAATAAAAGAQIRRQAGAFEPEKRVPQIWKKATEFYEAAQEQYESGNFSVAASKFKQAQSAYRQGSDEARTLYLQEMIRNARAAAGSGKWETVSELAQKIRNLDKKTADELLALADNGKTVDSLKSGCEKALKEGDLAVALRLMDQLDGKTNNDPVVNTLRKKLVAACKKDLERLQDAVETSKNEIEAANYDRGQGFGSRLDILNKKFEEAVARKKTDPVSAYKFLKEAESAAGWITVNVALREKAGKKLERAAEVRADADKFYRGNTAVEEYEAAAAAHTEGIKKYHAGEFETAVRLFDTALVKYENVRSKSMAAYEQEHLRSAEDAFRRKSWEELKRIAEELYAVNENRARELVVKAENGLRIEKWFSEAANYASVGDTRQALELLDKILALDENHQEAGKLKKKIEERQQIGIKVIALYDNEEVVGEVSLDGEVPFESGSVYKRLKKGRSYSGTLSYQGYVRKISFFCNWNGVVTKKFFLGQSSSSRKFVLPNGVVLNMIRISAGSFTMGTVPGREEGQAPMESPAHKVTVNDDFWIGEVEVTQEQYQAVMKSNPTWVKGRQHPVAGINWGDAKRFCQRLNRYCSKQLPDGYKFDLPTEAQWEYACRAGTQTPLNSGKELIALNERCYNLDDLGWYKFNSSSLMPVKGKTPNAWGLYDMHGNVAEWCLDYYGDYKDGHAVDPAGASGGRYRVYRGGSWKDSPAECRSASRFGGDPVVEHFQNVGFRIVLVPQF